jgi:hypothetical protein
MKRGVVKAVRATRPLLLIDIDGPLNPYLAKPHRRPAGYTTHRMKPRSWASKQDGPATLPKPLRIWLNPDHGLRLRALPYDLVWCTAWMHDANEWIAPRLGLPALPVIEFGDLFDYPPDGTHWKTRTVIEWAAGRPFAWIDDEINQADEAYVAAHHDGPVLLHHVHPAKGLVPADFAALRHWADELTVGPTPNLDDFG